MKNWLKKVTGIAKLEKEALDSLAVAEQAKKIAEESVAAAERAKEAEELAKLTPKERATRKKEPWVGVLNTHVNQDNVRNGFFELDWNEHFVEKLKKEGYNAITDEATVNLWFMELCRNVALEEFDGTGNFTGDSEANLAAARRWNSSAEMVDEKRKGYR
jgi:hypothetical protein